MEDLRGSHSFQGDRRDQSSPTEHKGESEQIHCRLTANEAGKIIRTLKSLVGDGIKFIVSSKPPVPPPPTAVTNHWFMADVVSHLT